MFRADRYTWQAARLFGNRSGSFVPTPPIGSLNSLYLFVHPLSDNPKTIRWNRRPAHGTRFSSIGSRLFRRGSRFFRGGGKGMNFPRRGNRGRIRPFRCQAPSAPCRTFHLLPLFIILTNVFCQSLCSGKGKNSRHQSRTATKKGAPPSMISPMILSLDRSITLRLWASRWAI